MARADLCSDCEKDYPPASCHREGPPWEDVDDEWTKDIDAAHPTRSDSHEEYGIAMRMVGHRHSKHELVSLVNWLLILVKLREGMPSPTLSPPDRGRR